MQDLVGTIQMVSDWMYGTCEPIKDLGVKQQHAYIHGITDQALDTYGDES